jgi:diguanylate cyclase (GGDEF)-like protein
LKTLSHRAISGLVAVCLFFVLTITGVGIVAIAGLRNTDRTATSIGSDELATTDAAAVLARQVDSVYETAESFSSSTTPDARATLGTGLFDQLIPGVDADLAALDRLHAADPPAELAEIRLLGRQWSTLRALLDPNRPGSPAPGPSASGTQLQAAFTPLSTHIASLIAKEARAARSGNRGTASRTAITTWLIVAAMIFAALAAAALTLIGMRRIRRAVQPGQDQIEFSDTLQLAEDQDEAHQLLRRHLERAISGSTATVLNRNNSADRLEAMTELPPGSCLTDTLAGAEPKSCLAVRSGRPHREGASERNLLRCDVCGTCPGFGICTPLAVSGEVIGSVLLNRPRRYETTEEQQIRDSVFQAAPMLANLRNLAIAEMRAATDSLTGLPNKRAAADTLKRMLAQASRTLSPLALLCLDLDHFKNINDRLGHPVGDEALAGVGAALRSALRDSDFAARNGGEEFLVLLPNTDITGAVLAAENIRAAIAEIVLPGAGTIVTASVGIAVYPDHATTSDHLERLADAALYVAKRSGRDRVEVAANHLGERSELNPSPLIHQN